MPRLIDCTCFHLPVPSSFYIHDASPSYISVRAGKENFSSRFEVWVEKKRRGERWLLPFSRIFRRRWFFMPAGAGRIRKLTVGKHTALMAFHQDKDNVFHFAAAINLDRDHFLAFCWTSHSNVAAVDAANMPLTILKSLQLLGQYGQAWQEKRNHDDAEREIRLRKQQENYISVEEQAADPFHARQNPVLFAKLLKRLRKYPNLQPHMTGILSNARLAVGFVARKRDYYRRKGNTRFGGLPDLPPNLAWPHVDAKHLISNGSHGTLCRFMAQINCADLRGMQEYLPARGMLYFFIGTQRWEPSGSSISCKVFYDDSDPSALQSARALSVKPADIFDFHEGATDIKPAKVRIFPYISILHSADDESVWPPQNCPKSTYAIDGEEPFRKIEQLNIELTGHPSKTLHAVNADVAASFGGPYVCAARALGGNPQDYVVLLRLGAESKVSGFWFGDAGYIYFVIAKEKLKNHDFSEVYCNIEHVFYED